MVRIMRGRRCGTFAFRKARGLSQPVAALA
jgi:hypothetical protein